MLLLGAVLLFLLSKFFKVKPAALPYIRKQLLTDTELHFFEVLESVTPKHCYLLTQVRLANLVKLKQESGAFFWKQFSPIGMKCVDFVIVQRDTMRPLVVVELDDSSHKFEDRRQRDAFVDQVLNSVELPVLHWSAQRQYTKSELSRVIGFKLKEVMN